MEAAARLVPSAMRCLFIVRAKATEIVMVANEPAKSDEMPGADIAYHLVSHGVKVAVEWIVSTEAGRRSGNALAHDHVLGDDPLKDEEARGSAVTECSPITRQNSSFVGESLVSLTAKEAGAYLRTELLIAAAACTALPGQPRIEAATRDTERLAYPVRPGASRRNRPSRRFHSRSRPQLFLGCPALPSAWRPRA
jgi:hypothetical protein